MKSIPTVPEDRRVAGEYLLAVVRVVLGFMLIWAFLDKLFGLGFQTTAEAAIINGGSPTEYYLSNLVDGVFAGFYEMLAGNVVVDFLLMAGLLLVGVSLFLGVASRLGTASMCVMMVLMYTLDVPPTDNPLVDYHIVYILAVLAVFLLGGFNRLSLADRYNRLPVIRGLRILQ